MTEALDESLCLSATEARLVGCLIEKAATTPESYPLTLNALVMAANQKTSREPVLSLEEGEVGHALRELEDRGWLRVVHGSRALRYEHCVDAKLSTTKVQRALLCLLLLRGPQTASELLTRSERLIDPTSLDEVKQVLERLQQRGFASNVGRASGQREDRFAHLFCGPVALPESRSDTTETRQEASLAKRVAELEALVAVLQERIAALESVLR